MTSGLQNTYQILLTINILYIAFVLLTFYVKSRIKNLLIRILVTSLITCIIIFNPDIFFRQQLLPGIRVTGSKDSPYGNITTGEYGGEKSLYYNQRLLSYNDDVTEREENIHYAMLQIANPENVLLLSGSLSSHFSEIMKYPVKRVIYVERDPVLAFEEKILIPDKDTSKLTIVHDDALRFMKKTSDKFDVVIVLLPPPSTLLLNRYYTTEFYKIVKSKLKPKGIFMCSPGPGNNYFNEESVNLYSSVFNSMTPYFKNVKPVNGNKLFFIASDADLSLSFSQLTDIRKIKTIYVNSDFLNDDLINKKSDEVLSLMNPEIKRNSSAFPIACFHFQSYSFSRNLDEKIPAIVFIILLFALPSLFIKRRSMFMYFSAASLAGFEIIVLLILQITFGSMYQLSGLIIAGLMGGLAAGSGMNLKFLNRFTLRFIAILLMIFYVLTGSLFNYINLINHEIPEVILIIILAFLPAFMTGHIFRRLTLGKEGETLLSETYSADLAGSALGFIFISGFIVPLFGIKVSIYMLSLLIFTGFMLGTVKNKS
jgi:spermidine synthase